MDVFGVQLPETLGGQALELVAPGSLAERWDIAILAAQITPGTQHRLHAAALGLCWPRFRRRHPYRQDAMAYSSTVIDALIPLGVRLADLALPGAAAVRLCLEGLVPVEGAEGFSEPPPDGSTAGG